MNEAGALISAIVQQMNVGLLVVDADMRICHWNRFLEIHSGYSAGTLVGRPLFDSFPDLNRPWLERKLRAVLMLRNFSFTSWRERPYLFKFALVRPATGGSDVMRQDCTFIALRDRDGSVKHVAIVIVDATENYLSQQALDVTLAELRTTHAQLQREIAERQAMEVELRKAHRLEAVEHLAAGLAHEVNTPLQVISGASALLKEGMTATFALVDEYAALCRAAGASESDLAAAEETAELSFWRDEIPAALQRLGVGHERVARIISTLKGFTGASAQARKDVDVNELLAEALQFAAPLYEKIADVELGLGEVPSVMAASGSLGQVFLSLIINAAQAIEKATKAGGPRGTIRVSTACEDEHVIVAVTDTGEGIPEAARPHIFDLFFTTRDVGSGMGAGLALAYATVTKEHGGKLTFTTQDNRGTTFYVRLPARTDITTRALL
jgi:two-component system NtrC family sensor kinase